MSEKEDIVVYSMKHTSSRLAFNVQSGGELDLNQEVAMAKVRSLADDPKLRGCSSEMSCRNLRSLIL